MANANSLKEYIEGVVRSLLPSAMFKVVEDLRKYNVAMRAFMHGYWGGL